MSDRLLQDGIRALQAGERRRARRLLGQVVNEEPDNAAAWWYLAAVTDDRAQRAHCLRQVLRLEPDHTEAARLLARLERRLAPLTPARGTARPVLDALEDTRGDLRVVVPLREALLPARDVGARAAVILALLAVLVALALAWAEAGPRMTGEAGAEPSPTLRLLVVGVPACTATGSGETSIIFRNGTGVGVEVLQGPPGAEALLLAVEPGAEGMVEAQPAVLTRYTIRTLADGVGSGSAWIEVPRGSLCRVPVE